MPHDRYRGIRCRPQPHAHRCDADARHPAAGTPRTERQDRARVRTRERHAQERRAGRRHAARRDTDRTGAAIGHSAGGPSYPENGHRVANGSRFSHAPVRPNSDAARNSRPRRVPQRVALRRGASSSLPRGTSFAAQSGIWRRCSVRSQSRSSAWSCSPGAQPDGSSPRLRSRLPCFSRRPSRRTLGATRPSA
jgi:hypothetical protein